MLGTRGVRLGQGQVHEQRRDPVAEPEALMDERDIPRTLDGDIIPVPIGRQPWAMLLPLIFLVLFGAAVLDSAMDAIAPAMDGKCAVLPQLNGIAHLERLHVQRLEVQPVARVEQQHALRPARGRHHAARSGST